MTGAELAADDGPPCPGVSVVKGVLMPSVLVKASSFDIFFHRIHLGTIPRSVPLRLVHHTQQRLAGGEAAQVFTIHEPHAFVARLRTRSDVWCDDHVGQLPELVAGW